MNSQEIFALIERIASTSSKKDKESMLAQHKDNPALVKVLKYAYDPFITFGVGETTFKNMAVSPGFYGTQSFDDRTWALLDRLASRDLSGGAAIDAIAADIAQLDQDSATLLRRIILKDLRAGFSESTINKAIPGTIPDFPYMRCSLPDDVKLEDWDWSQGMFSQEKADGMFVNVSIDKGGHVWVTTRQGSPFPIEKAEQLMLDIQHVLTPDTQSHGEMLVMVDGKVLPREVGNGVLNSMLSGGDLPAGHHLVIHLWDQIPLSAVKPKGKCETPYHERLRSLAIQLNSAKQQARTGLALVPTQIVYSLDEARRHCAGFTKLGKEGTVVKHRDAIWRDGTSKQQVKFKVTFEVDLVVVGFEEGKGKNAATFGSLITESSCGGLRVSVSGFSDKERARIHAAREEVLGMVITVAANSVMNPSSPDKPYSLFLPRHVEFRADKTEADTLERVIQQYHAAMGM